MREDRRGRGHGPVTPRCRCDRRAGSQARGRGPPLARGRRLRSADRLHHRRAAARRDAPHDGGDRRRDLLAAPVLGVVLTILLIASGGAILLVLAPLLAGLEYLDFVFSSSLSLMIAVILACATWLAGMAFGSAAERARAVGDASVFVSFFWVG